MEKIHASGFQLSNLKDQSAMNLTFPISHITLWNYLLHAQLHM